MSFESIDEFILHNTFLYSVFMKPNSLKIQLKLMHVDI